MRFPRVRFTVQRIMIGVAVTAIALGVIISVSRAGRIIEELRSAVAVADWSESGLTLVDGRTVSFPGLRLTPELAPALAEATRRGVELAPDGRVYALVRVHHWCGNDPIREHIARVDLARMLLYLSSAASTLTPDLDLPPRGGRFTASGWEVSQFQSYPYWCAIVESRGKLPALQAVVRLPGRPYSSAKG